MFGWRGRIGLIIPNVNTVIEPEFNSIKANGISCHVSRMLVNVESEWNLSSLIEMADGTEVAAKELKGVVDVIGYGCTSGSFAKGAEWDKQLIEQIEAISQCPATTATTSLVKALNFLGVTKLTLATPYTNEANEKQKDLFEKEGFKIVNMKGLDIREHGAQGLCYPSVAYNLAKEIVSVDSEALVISCTNFRTFEIIELLEKDLGIPVVTSNQALLWMLLKTIKVRHNIDGLGSLFKKYVIS